MRTYQLNSLRLIFREINWKDTQDIHQLHSDPLVDEFNTLGIPKNIEQTKTHMRGIIENREREIDEHICWHVRKKENNDFVGIGGVKSSFNRFKLGEIYYNVLPVYWGKGYGTEIAKRLILFGFNEFALHRIEAGVATENIRSMRVLEKCGMTQEGIRRKILPIRGEWKDNYHYAILEDDQRNY